MEKITDYVFLYTSWIHNTCLIAAVDSVSHTKSIIHTPLSTLYPFSNPFPLPDTISNVNSPLWSLSNSHQRYGCKDRERLEEGHYESAGHQGRIRYVLYQIFLCPSTPTALNMWYDLTHFLSRATAQKTKTRSFHCSIQKHSGYSRDN